MENRHSSAEVDTSPEAVRARVQQAEDPAMTPRRESAPSLQPSAVEQPRPLPAHMVVDLQEQRVFLPGKGWLSAEAFWDLYYHHSQELPPDLDHHALQALRRPSP